MFKLEGKISYLVPFEEKHLNDKQYFNWLRDYEVIKTINRLDYICPINFEAVKEYCEKVIRSNNDIFLAIYYKDNNKFIGTIRVNNLNWYTRIADIGILMGDKKYWGKGIAKEAIFSVLNYLFEILGMRKLTAGLMDINPAMEKVFEKLGFKLEGRMRKSDRYEGKYIDHLLMSCFKDEFNWEYLK